MAKSNPLRLELTLVDAADQASKLAHRSTAGQIEYWASLGRVLSRIATPEQLIAIQAGTAQLSIERIDAEPVDPDAVFAEVDRARESGRLAQDVTSSAVRYQASKTLPGYLEQVAPDGSVTVGTFSGGTFHPTAIEQQAAH